MKHLTEWKNILIKTTNMRLIFKTILKYYLKYITKLVLLIHRPTIIAVAGSTNKTFTVREIKRVLQENKVSVRANPKNFNTEIGLPLAILNLPSGYNEFRKWLLPIVRAPLAIFSANFPKFLVLELGISGPGNMRYLLSIIKPKIFIITDITQRYIDSFAGMDELVGEYEYLLKRARPSDLVVLNYDNTKIRQMAGSKIAKRKRIEFFGFNDRANWQAIEAIKSLSGQQVKTSNNNIVKEYFIPRFGNHHVYALLSGLIINKYVSKREKTS